MTRTYIVLISILVVLVGVYLYVALAGPVPHPPSLDDLKQKLGESRAVERSEVEAQGRDDCFAGPASRLVLAPRGSCSVHVGKTWPWVRRDLRLDRLGPVPMHLALVPAGEPGVPLRADPDPGEKPRVTIPIPSSGGTVSVTCVLGCSALLVASP
jgi:hypothetical protein